MKSRYDRFDFNKDVVAGSTVAVVLIPQAMAYALLMGIPPVYGLFAGLLPLLVYALMGHAFPMSIGPVAISSILVYSGISQIAEPFSDHFITLVIATGLFIGVFKWLLGVFRLGFLVNFISLPVVSGFISASALIIIITQLKDVLGIRLPSMTQGLDLIPYAIGHWDEVSGVSLAVFGISLLMLIAMKYWKEALPGTLLVMILFTALTYIFEWDQKGLAVVGEVPGGLPRFQIPDIPKGELRALLPTVLTVSFISIVECMSIGRSLEMKSESFRLIPNRELRALGLSKIAGAFFQSPPTSASFSRSAINYYTGARSGLSSIISALIVALSLIFLTPFFYYIPNAVLAAVIIIAVAGLIDHKHALYLWKVKRREFLVMAFTFFVTLIFGIDDGVITGIVLSFAIIIYYSSRPQIVELGNIPGTTHYRNIERFSKAKRVRDYLIIRFDDQLYFGNANYFRDTIIQMFGSRTISPKYLLLDASNIHDLDSTGLYSLKEIYEYLQKHNTQLIISGATGPIRDLLKRSGLMDTIGSQNHFMYIKNAVQLSEEDQNEQWLPEAVQYNPRNEFILPVKKKKKKKKKINKGSKEE